MRRVAVRGQGRGRLVGVGLRQVRLVVHLRAEAVCALKARARSRRWCELLFQRARRDRSPAQERGGSRAPVCQELRRRVVAFDSLDEVGHALRRVARGRVGVGRRRRHGRRGVLLDRLDRELLMPGHVRERRRRAPRGGRHRPKVRALRLHAPSATAAELLARLLAHNFPKSVARLRQCGFNGDNNYM